jgi:hypothetical protein
MGIDKNRTGIGGREKIGDRVILLPEGARPPAIPFSLRAQRSTWGLFPGR